MADGELFKTVAKRRKIKVGRRDSLLALLAMLG